MKEEPGFGLDTSVFLGIIEDGTADQRRALARQLAEFTAKPEAPEAERQQVVPALLKLAVDPVFEVRHTLASILSRVANLDADLLFSIISDDDSIALPFLAVTPALGHWQMLAVLRVGDAARQTCVAMRHDLSSEGRDYILKSGTLETCLALLENPEVELNDLDYHGLYTRFGQVPEMIDRLLGCPDLPLDIRILQAKRASNRMHQLMAERGWLAANDAAELVADAEETAVLRILVDASEAELDRVVPFLIAKAMLTPSIVVRAACLGELHVVERTLAHLAGVSPSRAREAMQGRGMMRLRALLARSGLPKSCLGLLHAACDVANDERAEGIDLDAASFGRRLIEALMTRYETMLLNERGKNLEFVARFAEDRVRIIARRLKADLVRAA